MIDVSCGSKVPWSGCIDVTEPTQHYSTGSCSTPGHTQWSDTGADKTDYGQDRRSCRDRRGW